MSSTVELAADSVTVVKVAELGEGVTSASVEGFDAGVSVAHRVVATGMVDQGNCANATSDRWYFAAANSEAGNNASVWLLNPYPTDASVDLSIVTDVSVRVPSAFRGIIVPAGSARMVDLGDTRRAQFAVSVVVRGGRVAAELVQRMTSEDNSGVRLQMGAPGTATSWVLADSFAGDGLSEQLQIFNPGGRATTVSVAVIPNGVAPEAFPEPFIVDVAARRYVTIDLGAETRLPATGLRWLSVRDVEGTGVVINQVVRISSAAGDGSAESRPAVAGGVASSTGSSVQAERWTVTSIDPGPDSQSVLVIANSSPDAIAVVSLVEIVDGERRVVVDRLEVPPLQSTVVDLGDVVTDSAAAIVVESNSPVMVAARSTSADVSDLSMWPAVPDAGSSTSLDVVDGG